MSNEGLGFEAEGKNYVFFFIINGFLGRLAVDGLTPFMTLLTLSLPRVPNIKIEDES